MKVCVAQTRPIRGDIPGNIANHKKLVDVAASEGAEIVIFPELSLTGYEPELAKELATNQDDRRFDDFQKIADARQITIGLGAPTQDSRGVSISAIIFQPHKPRQTYSKKYIHLDEEPFFVRGQSPAALIRERPNIALAICYELSIPAHSENAFKSGAEVYVASVAKSASGVDKAARTLSDIAKKYSMTVLMANCIGPSSGFESAGGSAAWNRQGLLIGQLDATSEGIIIVDTDTLEVFKKIL